MTTGISVDDQCLEAYNALKLGKKYQYLVFKLSDDLKQIVVEKTAPANADKSGAEAEYKAFVASLPKDDCLYAVYDFFFSSSTGDGERNKILFISWVPDTAKVKQKMVYAGSKSELRKRFEGVSAEIQATDLDELDYEAVLEKVGKK
ncbi:hypothetical protein DFJ74DRAFT_678480 [Hyaloraphidium curvatum]|nr:hypothetical protein DFJ74DRAFT_678480 [Hyaloraphidium curvatum]